MEETDKAFEDDIENITAKLREAFREEAYDLISELESALLELERSPGDADVIGRVFRAMHTIKGSGGACGFFDVSEFTHEIESFFDLIRKGKIAVTGEIINLTLVARDQIKMMFDAYYRDGSFDTERTRDIVSSFKSLLPSPQAKANAPIHHARPHSEPDSAIAKAPARHPAGKNITYRIRFRPSPGILAHGTDPVRILNDLRKLGHCTVVAQTESIPYLEDCDPALCYTFWDAILTTDRGTDSIHHIFHYVKDRAEITIDVIDEEGRLDDEMSYKRLDEILIERGDLAPDDLEKVLKSKRRLGEMLVDAGVISGDKVQSALMEQQHVREAREKRQGADAFSSIRVATQKLDSLVDLVGELVTVQARLSQTAVLHGIPDLVAVSEEVERLTADLRDQTMSMRMVPIGAMFSKFTRVVRDLSLELGKEIDLSTDGAETELDKTVIERLNDPLVHLIRNSIDHGIETPAERSAAGKQRRGAVRLSAQHSGAHVLIRIQDDGAGLDRDAIRNKAVEKGIISSDMEMPDKEVFGLIFAPGFSTAKKVTSVSGRGVGLDVVKKTIEALRGTVEIESRQGEGATITLRLPLTLAIIDGLLVNIQEQHFIVPLSFVNECVELNGANGHDAEGRHIANVRGEIIPYINLREMFAMSGERPLMEQIVITSTNGAKIGLVVDAVIGGRQTVIKNLGRMYRDVTGVSGATILGDGAVALILDVPKLIQIVEQEGARV